jgi:hypothetical protein
MSAKSRIGCETSSRIGGLTALMSSRLGLGPMNDTSDHDRLADRIDRRVRDLREQLLEVVVERLVLSESTARANVAHRADAFLAGLGHRAHQELDVFLV